MIPPAESRHSGFALVMVVFLLFAVTVAGMTGYQIVSAESDLATTGESVEEALSVARAGLSRYIGEHIGIPGPDTYGAIGDGSVTITPTRVAKYNDSTDVYLLTAVATVTDPRYPSSPSRRVVRQYAYLNMRPIKVRGAFMSTQPTVVMQNPNVNVNGNRSYAGANAAADCPAGDTVTAATAGIAHGGSGTSIGGSGAPPLGAPAVTPLLAPDSVIKKAAVRWSVIKDASFSILHTRPSYTWPNFASLPADSFPVVRYSGDYTLDTCVGKGVLIVTGTFRAAGNNCTWKGIVLVGTAVGGSNASYDNSGLSGNGATIQGALITGLNNANHSGNQQLTRFHVDYYPCYVRRANRALAYLTPISHSAWEF
jgi:hypothetical protein